uniref:MADS-box domain-containing protein n=2 Tax=Aegilops tauschii TaxID=37682 RepID=A0A453TB71_AEGTS
MGRLPKKVTLGYVRHDSTRRSRYKQRLKGLMKKAGDLATLCDVDTCVVVYGEDGAAPEVFPSSDKAVGILNGFKSMPELGHCKKTMDQEGLLTERIAKLQEQVDKSRRECQDRETRYLLQQIMDGNLPGHVGLSVEQLARVGYKVEEMIKTMGERMGKTHSQAPPPAPCVTTGSIDMGSPALHQA